MQHFEPRPPIDVLQDVFLLKKRKDKGEAIELPLLTILLHNKQAFSGFLMDLKRQTNEAYHLTVELEGSSNLFFAEAYYIQGVVVHEIKKLDYLLTSIEAANAGERTSTKLEIKTRIAEETTRLTSYFGKPLEIKVEGENIGPKEFYFVKNLVADVSMSLLFIGEDEPGKGAIIDSIDKVVFRKGNDLTISVEDRMLIVTDNFTRSYSTNLRRADLQQAIIDKL